MGIFALRRRDWALLALAAVVAANQLAALADSPTQVFRYMAAPLLIGPMLLPLFLARARRAPLSEEAGSPARRPAA